MDAKRYLKDLFKFGMQKLDDGTCSPDELRSVADTASKNISSWATIEEIARFYNQTPNNVRVVINRKLIMKPRRKVLYSFTDFAKIVPESWKKKDE